MADTRLLLCNIIVLLTTSSKLLVQAEERRNGSLTWPNESQGLNVFPGIKFFLVDGEVTVRVRIRELLQGTRGISCYFGVLTVEKQGSSVPLFLPVP